MFILTTNVDNNTVDYTDGIQKQKWCNKRWVRLSEIQSPTWHPIAVVLSSLKLSFDPLKERLQSSGIQTDGMG